MRNGLLIATVAGTAVLAVTVAVVRLPHRSTAATTATDPSTITAKITRMTLTEKASVDGMLGYGPEEPIESKAPGTLTWLPEIGTVLGRGDTLLHADEKPVVLLYGGVPMYRTLQVGAVGSDVEQFEANLHALHYAGFTVDARYTAATSDAVKRWQHALGVPETGTVDAAAVLYARGPVRVAGHTARLGASATGQVLTYTADTKLVTAQVPVRGAAWAARGTPVDIVLPTGATVAGSVAGAGAEAGIQSPGEDANSSTGAGSAQGGEFSATVTITITIADQRALGALDRAPVKVRHTIQQRRNVLTVPVTALLAPIEGGYALEVVDGGHGSIVPVETGLFAGGRVEVRGPDIAAGMSVRVPS